MLEAIYHAEHTSRPRKRIRAEIDAAMPKYDSDNSGCLEFPE